MRTLSIKLGVLVVLVLILPVLFSFAHQSNLYPSPAKNTLNTIQSDMYACEQEKAQVGCYRRLAVHFIDTDSLAQVLGVLERLELDATSHKQDYFTCHKFTHYLGQEIFNHIQSVPKTFASCTMACGGGCYHGAIEGYFNQRFGNAYGTISDAMIRHLMAMCGSEENYPTKGIYIQCIHGLGHAAMFVTDNDVPRSLYLCDALDSDSRYCYAGVFMENVRSSTQDLHPTRFLRADDPLYPCNALPEKYLHVCFTLQVFHFIIISDYDWNKAAELCDRVPEPYHAGCFLALAGIRIHFTHDPNELEAGCDIIANASYKNECIKRVVNDMSARYGENTRGYMYNFCKVVPEENKEGCFRQMGKTLSFWAENNEKLQSFCRELKEEKYVAWCLKGIND